MAKQKQMSGLQDQEKPNIKNAINIFETDNNEISFSDEVDVDGTNFKITDMSAGDILMLLEKAKIAIIYNEDKFKR